MATPTYFQNFPNIQYAYHINKAGKPSFLNIKDYFHLLVPRDDIYREETLYVEYIVKNGERPDQISYEEYGDEQYYWIILQINQITDFYNQWPLSQDELSAYISNKYGGDTNAGKVHHYETFETFDQATPPNLVLPGGLTVPEDFVYSYPQKPGLTQYETSLPVPVTNRQYEEGLNAAKSAIFILDKKYVYDYTRDIKNYAKNLAAQSSYVEIGEANITS